jgi:hypothetical protein
VSTLVPDVENEYVNEDAQRKKMLEKSESAITNFDNSKCLICKEFVNIHTANLVS